MLSLVDVWEVVGCELTCTGEVAVVATKAPVVESLRFLLNTISPLDKVSETLDAVRDRVFGELISGRLRTDEDWDTTGVLVSLPGPMLNIPPLSEEGLNDDRLFPFDGTELKIPEDNEEAIDFCTAAPAAWVEIVAEAVDRSVVGTEEPRGIEWEQGDGLKKLEEKVPVDEDKGK